MITSRFTGAKLTFVVLCTAVLSVGIGIQPVPARSRANVHPCPSQLPYPGLAWVNKTWKIPWYEHPATKSPFTPTLLLNAGPSGDFQAYYEPVEGIDTEFDGHEWTWYEPEVHYTCIPSETGQGFLFFPTPWVAPSGFALIIDGEYCGGGEGEGEGETLRSSPTSGLRAQPSLANTCYGGGGYTEPDCWEVWEWWFDNQGVYHEHYLGTYCEYES
jgi:hypothetical protein